MQANKDWLAEKAKEEGVMPLPKGIYYKVLASGKNDGKHPTPRSIVTAHYTGWTINGKKFDSSRSGAPVAFRLSDLIEGWIIAMQQMCVGDKWEVYIPSEMGYGKFSQPGIPGGSTLIFEIELFGIACTQAIPKTHFSHFGQIDKFYNNLKHLFKFYFHSFSINKFICYFCPI